MCSTCLAGYYCPALGISSPLPCPLGSYCTLGSNTSIPCPAGYVCPALASNFSSCPAGSYTVNTSSSSCILCPAGYYCSSTSWIQLMVAGSQPVTQSTYDQLFNAMGVMYRFCANCMSSHQFIYYKRLSSLVGFSAYQNSQVTWSSSSNVLNTDFSLYSSFSDLFYNIRRWTACNYGATGRGFPNDCGPSAMSNSQWNSLTLFGGQGLNVDFFALQPVAILAPAVCPVGSYCMLGATSASPCNPGTYNPSVGVSACLNCTAGSFCSVSNLTSPTVCNSTVFCPLGTINPTPCPAGYEIPVFVFYNRLMGRG